MPKPLRIFAETTLNLPLFSPIIALVIILIAIAPEPEPGTETLGTWRVEYAGFDITTSILRSGSRYTMEQRLAGDRIVEPLTKTGNRYYLPSGDYFVIDSGNLELYDSDGLVWAAR